MTSEESHGQILNWWPGGVEESGDTSPEEEKSWLGVGVRGCLWAIFPEGPPWVRGSIIQTSYQSINRVGVSGGTDLVISGSICIISLIIVMSCMPSKCLVV